MTQQACEEEKKRMITLLRKEYGDDVWFGSTKCGVCNAHTQLIDIETVVDYLLSNGAMMPPCKVGDTVYVISQFADDIVHTGVVERMCIDEEGNEIIIVGNDWFVDDIGVCKSPSDFGKTAFLTHEEAEQALKERAANA